MTIKEYIIKKKIMFDGEFCDEKCDFYNSIFTRLYEYDCELFNTFLSYCGDKHKRCEKCIKKFGLDDEKK